jgi:hypothetical protein
MLHNHQNQEPVQLELFRKTSKGWESKFSELRKTSNHFTTEQIEHHFQIPRQELYKIRNKPYCTGASTLLFSHIHKNKWQVYYLQPVEVDNLTKKAV